VSAPTPLLDFFRRGEVTRDVKVLAATGALAPRAHEQLLILVFLLDDPDHEIKTLAAQTLDKIPVGALRTFLAQSDAPTSLREFFAARGIHPAPTASEAEQPLLGPDQDEEPEAEEASDPARESIIQTIAKMGFMERLKAAVKGSREVRAILVRDPNKMIAAAVLSSPKLTEKEVESIARMANVSDDVLRIIGSNRAWTKNYSIVVGLTRNPKTPLAMSLNMLARLNDSDVKIVSTDRNIPEALRAAARRKVAAAHK
jgi:hypothetical protein